MTLQPSFDLLYVKINMGEPECVHRLAVLTFLFYFFSFFAPVLASQTGKDGKFKPCYPGNFFVSVQFSCEFKI